MLSVPLVVIVVVVLVVMTNYRYSTNHKSGCGDACGGDDIHSYSRSNTGSRGGGCVGMTERTGVMLGAGRKRVGRNLAIPAKDSASITVSDYHTFVPIRTQ